MRALPNPGLLQGDTVISQRAWICSSAHQEGGPTLCPEDCSLPSQRREKSCEAMAPWHLSVTPMGLRCKKDRGFGEAPGKQCQVQDRMGTMGGSHLSLHSGWEGGTQGREGVTSKLREATLSEGGAEK